MVARPAASIHVLKISPIGQVKSPPLYILESHFRVKCWFRVFASAMRTYWMTLGPNYLERCCGEKLEIRIPSMLPWILRKHLGYNCIQLSANWMTSINFLSSSLYIIPKSGWAGSKKIHKEDSTGKIYSVSKTLIL